MISQLKTKFFQKNLFDHKIGNCFSIKVFEIESFKIR